MADDLKAPEVQWRDLNGAVADEFGRKLPPGIIDYSTSEGDMRKRAYRKSKYPGAFTLSAVNDDGTPIADGTNTLLTSVLKSLSLLRDEVAALNAKMQALLELE